MNTNNSYKSSLMERRTTTISTKDSNQVLLPSKTLQQQNYMQIKVYKPLDQPKEFQSLILTNYTSYKKPYYKSHKPDRLVQSLHDFKKYLHSNMNQSMIPASKSHIQKRFTKRQYNQIQEARQKLEPKIFKIGQSILQLKNTITSFEHQREELFKNQDKRRPLNSLFKNNI